MGTYLEITGYTKGFYLKTNDLSQQLNANCGYVNKESIHEAWHTQDGFVEIKTKEDTYQLTSVVDPLATTGDYLPISKIDGVTPMSNEEVFDFFRNIMNT